MKNGFTDFLGVNDLVRAGTASDLDDSSIVLLTTRGWINGRLIQNHDVGLVTIDNILEHFNNFSVEIKHVVIVVENHLCFR